MRSLQVEVQAADGAELPLSAARLEAALRRVLELEGVQQAELSVVYVGDRRIAELNQEYLQHDGPTDVIAFPLHAHGQPVLGDVYIGAEQAARQAAELGVPLEEELLRLAIHGALHVLGYQHPDGPDRERSPMYRRQEELLAEVLRRPDTA